jgi:hypothetical protein
MWKFSFNGSDSTHWNFMPSVLPDKLIVAQLFKIFPAFMETHYRIPYTPLTQSKWSHYHYSNKSFYDTFQYSIFQFACFYQGAFYLCFPGQDVKWCSHFSHSCCKPFNTNLLWSNLNCPKDKSASSLTDLHFVNDSEAMVDCFGETNT